MGHLKIGNIKKLPQNNMKGCATVQQAMCSNYGVAYMVLSLLWKVLGVF